MRATSARDAASNVSMSCCFRRSAVPAPSPPPEVEGNQGLSPRRDQVPERRIFEAQPPNTDPFQSVLVHQRQLEPQRVRALDPELVVHTPGAVAEMHLLLGRIE